MEGVPSAATAAATVAPFTLWVPPGYTFRELCKDAASRWGSVAAVGLIPEDDSGAVWPESAPVLDALASASPAAAVPPVIPSRLRVYMRIGAAGPLSQHQEEVLPAPQRRPQQESPKVSEIAKVATTTPTTSAPRNAIPNHPLGKAAELWAIFVFYAVKSSGDDLQLQERPFREFCRDCGLAMLDSEMSVSEEESSVVYHRHISNGGAHKMTFEQFLDALADLAHRVLDPRSG